jgi:hypothetical protein
MRGYALGVATAAALAAALGVGTSGARAQEAPAVDIACHPTAPAAQLAKRASPYDSTAIVLGTARGQVCYSRPLLRGRHMIGGDAVPFGKLWRTGANEPTIVSLPVAATIAGLRVEPGSYALYTVPDEKQWTIVVNRSTKQWGIENQYTAAIQEQELGRAQVSAEAVKDAIEQFTIRSVPAGQGRADLVLEWEHSRVKIPVVAVH